MPKDDRKKRRRQQMAQSKGSYQDKRQELRNGQTLSRNLIAREPAMSPTPIVEKTVEIPKVDPAEQLGVIPIQGPKQLAETRRDSAMQLAMRALKDINDMMQESLTLNPSIETLDTSIGEYPSDVQACILQSLERAGYRLRYDGDQWLTIELPRVDSIAQYAVTRVSSIAPL